MAGRVSHLMPSFTIQAKPMSGRRWIFVISLAFLGDRRSFLRVLPRSIFFSSSTIRIRRRESILLFSMEALDGGEIMV